MERSNGFDSSEAYRLVLGNMSESPILLPLAGGDCSISSMMRFCRRIAPGARLLIVDLPQIGETTHDAALMSKDLIADALASIILCAVQTHDLSLIPIIVVGNAEGADIAVCLGLRHGTLLGACILLRPTAQASLVNSGAMNGVHVLLMRNATEKVHERVGSHLLDVLKRAGAEVICERIPAAKSLGSRETAIAHVFVATLFGT